MLLKKGHIILTNAATILSECVKRGKRGFLSLLTVVCDTDRICSNNAQPISIKKDVNTTKKDLMEIEPI